MTKRPKPKTPTAIELLTPARTTREKVTEFAPMVLYAPRRGQAYTAQLEPAETIADSLGNLLAAMRRKLGPAEWIAVTTDAYVKRVDGPEDEPTSPLSEAFVAGDPGIIEQMVVVLRHRYKPTETASQTYRYIPSEGWEWDEPEEVESQQSAVQALLDYFII